MTTYISSYTPELVLPNYKTTEYDPTLPLKLLSKKQQEYDVFLSRINNLRSESINISMLNMKGKEKLDSYNEQLKNLLSQDLGDLSDPMIQNKVASYFSTVASDSDLKEKSRISQVYESQNADIERRRRSDDPTKSGYNKINEYVYQNWKGGLYDFMKAEDTQGWKPTTYTPYKDVDQKLVNLTKLLKEEERTTQQSTGGPYMTYSSTKGVSKGRIRELLETTLDQDEMEQFDVMAKYRTLINDSDSLYRSYNNWLDKESQNTQGELQIVQERKKQYQTMPSGLSDSQKTIWEQNKKSLDDQELSLQKSISYQNLNKIGQKEWMRKDKEDILPFIKQLTYEDYINGVSDALSYKSIVEKDMIDPAYFAKGRLDLDYQKEKNLGAWRQAQLSLEQMKIETDRYKAKLKAGSDENWSESDAVKNEVSMYANFSDIKNKRDQIAGKASLLITQGTPQLNNPQWLTQNKDNYEVKLFNIYKARTGNSSIEGFKEFTNQVNQGMFNTDPGIIQIRDDQSRDKLVAEDLTEAVDMMSEKSRELTNYQNVGLGGNTLADYARLNGWDGTGEMTFGVRDGKGGYKQMAWSDIKAELVKGGYTKDWQKTLGAIVAAPTVGMLPLVVDGMTDTYQRVMGSLNPTSLDNDMGFKKIAMAAMAKENESAETLQKEFTELMPNYLQGTMLISSDKGAKREKIGDINSALKLQGDGSSIGIVEADIDQVVIPKTLGEYGYFTLTPEAAKKFNDNKNYPELKLATVDGEASEIKAFTRYRFKTEPAYQEDIYLQNILDKKGELSYVEQGRKVRISDPKNGMYYIQIEGAPKDTYIREKTPVSQLRGLIKQSILNAGSL
jgi:hypothetical protein